MSLITHTITRTYRGSGSAIALTETPTGDLEHNINKSMVIGTNVNILWAVTRANIKSLCIYSSTDATLYTNAASSGSPQDTIVLKAGYPLLYTLATDLIARCPFSANVTSLYLTNAAATIFQIQALLV